MSNFGNEQRHSLHPWVWGCTLSTKAGDLPRAYKLHPELLSL